MMMMGYIHIISYYSWDMTMGVFNPTLRHYMVFHNIRMVNPKPETTLNLPDDLSSYGHT